MTERLLTPADLATRYGVTIRGLRGLRYRRMLPPAIKVGTHLRWRPEDVLAWEASRLEAGGPP